MKCSTQYNQSSNAFLGTEKNILKDELNSLSGSSKEYERLMQFKFSRNFENK